MDVTRTMSEWFWDESIWFPPGVNWTTLKSTDIDQYPEFSDMYLPIGYAFIILLIRTAFEWSVARPLGKAFGIKDTGSELNNVYYRAVALSRKLTGTDHIPNHIQNGHAHRKMSTKRRLVPKSTLDKFCECCWRFAYYFSVFVYGLYVLWDKPWFWDTAHCWYGYPFQTVDNDVWRYYMLEASFYWSLMFSQFVDVHRKDFGMNFVHHLATIALLWFSWSDNFVRVGTLVLVVHDAADFWLEAGKMARYCNRVQLCNFLFACFVLVWFLTRVGIYPFRIIYSTTIEAPSLVGFYAAYYVFNTLLLVLLVLHILWSIMIVRIIINALKSGETDDVRSDDEDED